MPDRHAASREAAAGGTNRAAPEATAPRIERLRRSQDFRATMRSGKRARHPLIHVVARENGLDVTRAGLSASRRVGGSVVRNLVKRRLREALRAGDVAPGFDVVTIAQPPAAQATFQELSAALEFCLGRLKLQGPRLHRSTAAAEDASNTRRGGASAAGRTW